jgi:hypothetical protein
MSITKDNLMVKDENLLLDDHDEMNQPQTSEDEAIEFEKKRFRSNSQISFENCEDRIEKSRERNREHAKKTRLRKKIMLETLKARLLELQAEVSLIQNILVL